MIVGPKEQMEYSKDQRESIFDEMFIYIFFAGVGVVAVILLYIASKLFTFSTIGAKIKQQLQSIKKKFVFNGAIRSFTVSYIKLGIAASIQIMMQLSGSEFINPKERTNSIAIISVLSLSIIFFYIFIWYNDKKERLDT
jgi:hypothetical protein